MNGQAGWDAACRVVVAAMATHAERFVVSISMEVAPTEGELVGTGTFLRLRGQPYVLTNEHVARARLHGSLAYFAHSTGDIHRLVHPFQCTEYPVDAALARIDRHVFDLGDRAEVPPERIAPTFETATHELLFVMGFPGVRSRFSPLLGGLVTRAVPYLTQEMPLPAEHVSDAEHIFALHYPYDRLVQMADGRSDQLPDPRGVSGSGVWDTRYVHLRGRGWTPDHARLVGLVFGWDQDNHALLAVRIESVREFIVHALREEAAYFHWQARGSPLGDELSDWIFAVGAVPGIA